MCDTFVAEKKATHKTKRRLMRLIELIIQITE